MAEKENPMVENRLAEKENPMVENRLAEKENRLAEKENRMALTDNAAVNFEKSLFDQILDMYPTPESFAFDPNPRGRLNATRLPSDAWEKWCKDGALCFSMEGFQLMKVYFANPRDLMVYYVTDFVYRDFGLSPILFNVGCVLVGSRIYIIGGQRPYCTGYTKDVYFCDVAQPLLDGGGYEWMKGPSLNFDKAQPMTFSLSGKIYALSVEYAVSQPFEVLDTNSNSSCWGVLSQPPSPLWTGSGCNAKLIGSYCVGESKIIIHANPLGARMLFIYDVNSDQWQKVKMKDANLLDDLPIDVTYCVDVIDTCFLFDKLWKFYVLHFGHGNPSSSFSHPTIFDGENLVEDKIGLQSWQLVQLTGTKFCFISFYNSNAPLECRVRLCTFDFVVSFGADEQDTKGQKFAHHFVQNMQDKSHVLWDCSYLSTYNSCSKIGAFSPF